MTADAVTVLPSNVTRNPAPPRPSSAAQRECRTQPTETATDHDDIPIDAGHHAPAWAVVSDRQPTAHPQHTSRAAERSLLIVPVMKHHRDPHKINRLRGREAPTKVTNTGTHRAPIPNRSARAAARTSRASLASAAVTIASGKALARMQEPTPGPLPASQIVCTAVPDEPVRDHAGGTLNETGEHLPIELDLLSHRTQSMSSWC